MNDSTEKKYNKNKHNKHNNYKSNNVSFNRYIKSKEGEIQLFQKESNQTSLQTNHSNSSHNKEKDNLRQRNKQKNTNQDYYASNKIINHFLLNKTNSNKVIKNGSNNDKPIRLNYNKDIENEISDKENINNSNEYKYNIEQKINKMKKKICFKGNNDQFIEYLKLIKLKSDIINMVTNMFTDDDNEKVNEEEIKKYFYKLEHLKNNRNENENLLNIYKYLTEQLLMANNINRCDISKDI
jgi:hypothetical protein